jgi:Cache domain
MPNLLLQTRHWIWLRLRPDAALTSLFLLAALGIGWIVWDGHQARARADATASDVATLAAQDVARSLEQFDRALLAVIYRHQSLGSQDLDAQARNAPTFEALQQEPYFAFVDIVDKNGQAIAGLPRNTNNWSDRDYFGALEHSFQSNLFIGGRFSADSEQAVGVTVSRRMTDGEGNFAGLVVRGVRLAHFRQLLSQFGPAANQSLLLMRDDGVVLLRLPFHFNDVGDKLDPATPLYAALRAGETSAVAADPFDHVERRFALHPVGTFPLVIGIGTATGGSWASPMVWWLLASGCSVATLTLQRRRREVVERS